MIGVGPRPYFTLITRDIERVIDAIDEGGGVTAEIYNDAQSQDGTYYWRYVNDGRGPVRPVRTSVLHWVDPKSGKDVFAKYARGVAPRHIRENAVAAIRERSFPMPGGGLGRELVAAFVNTIAEIAIQEMVDRTPVVSGKLKDSYRLDPAK